MFEVLDERVQNAIEGFVGAFLGEVDQDSYFWLLPRTIIMLAQNDCVIVGRGAHLLLPDSLKVRVEASMETRVANMMRFEGLSAAEARRSIALSDKSRQRFTRRLMSLIPEKDRWYRNRLMYDLIINTDRCSVIDAAISFSTQRRHGSASAWRPPS